MKKHSQYAGLSIKELIANITVALDTRNFTALDQLYKEIDYALQYENRGMDWAMALAWRGKIRIVFHGQHTKGLEDALHAYYYFREVGDETKMCPSHLDIANCYMKFGLFDKVIEHLGDACILSRKIERYDTLISALIRLADAHGNLGNYEQAIRFCLEALAVGREHDVRHDRSYANMSLAQAYQFSGKMEEAHAAIEQAIAIAEEDKDLRAIIYAYNIQCGIYLGMRNHKKALAAAAACERYAKEAASLQHFYPVLVSKCFCLLDMGKTQQAYTTASRLLQKAKENNPLHEARMNDVLAQICTAMGKKKEASSYKKMYDEFMLQNAGEILKMKVYALTADFNARRHQMDMQLERERAQHLETKLAVKEKELTLLALNLAQKNEMLMNIEQKLQALEKKLNTARKSVQGAMETLISDVKSDIASSVHADKSWAVFEHQFTAIHPGFVERLSQKHPDLKPMELRLCALLKVNLSTKQIAHILCIDSRSVNVYRSRIRKKIRMGRASNLTAYLTGI